MSSFFITGANRGIGLELSRQLSALPESQVSIVFAAVRSVSSALQELTKSSSGRVVPIEVQVTKRASIDKAVGEVEKHLGGKGLDVLINNAGMMPFSPGGTEKLDTATFQETFNVNVVAVHEVTQAFLPLLRKGKDKKIVNISTTLGSIAMSESYKWAPAPAYKITKAALNSLTKNYALDLHEEGFTVIALSPGWLKTDLGSAQADLDVDVGVKACLDVILKEGRESNGHYRSIKVAGYEDVPGPNKYNGMDPPW